MTTAEPIGRDRANTAKPGRKTLYQMLGGAVVGAGSMLLVMRFIDDPDMSLFRADHVLALGTGLVMLLMALMVGLGALAPRAGALVLNVEDETEIRDERRQLLLGAASFLALGTFLFALGLYSAEPVGGVLDRRTATILTAVSVVGAFALSFMKYRSDEFTTLISKEAGALTGLAVTTLFAGWAALAHLGYTPMFTPLAFAGGALALFLLSVFVVVGRRGLMSR